MSGLDLEGFARPRRSLALGERAMIATAHPRATDAGVQILKDGGNAVDAALAAIAVLSVVEPQMTGVGGDCFALVGKNGMPPIAINGSGVMPRNVSLEDLKRKYRGRIPDDSIDSVTVPGAVDAWCRLAADHGSLPLEAVLAPAIHAAENGFLITERVAADWAAFASRLRSDEARDVYLLEGSPPFVGARMRNPSLARTLAEVARRGRDGFYGGSVAEAMVDTLRSFGGKHSLADFAAQRSFYDTPISTEFCGKTVYECPPNGQGLAALIMLRIIERSKLQPHASQSEEFDFFARMSRLVFSVRDHVVADPTTDPVDVDRFLNDAYIDTVLARMSDPPDNTAGCLLPEHRDTTYVCAVDRDGTCVSIINSLFHVFGAGIYCPSTGVLFHNRGSGFVLEEGHPNVAAGGKRPMHTIIPGMLYDGMMPIMPFGVMGGQYQAVGHAYLLYRLFICGDDLQTAISRERSFLWDGELRLESTVHPHTREALTGMGYRCVTADEPIGGAQAIIVRPDGILVGGSDHRKDGLASGF